jgi:hypothetical protein
VQPVHIGENFVVPISQLGSVTWVASRAEQGILNEHESLGPGQVAQEVAEGEGVLLMAPLEAVTRDAGGDPKSSFPNSFRPATTRHW